MRQALEYTDELRDGLAAEVVGREVQVLEMTQSEQGGAYLTSNGSPGHEFTFRVGVASDLELDDVAGLVAAPDSHPPAAVLLGPPRRKVVGRIGEAGLEGEKCISLAGDAGGASRC